MFTNGILIVRRIRAETSSKGNDWFVRYNMVKYSLSGTPASRLHVGTGRNDGVPSVGVEQFGNVSSEVVLGVASALAGRGLDARVDGRLASLRGGRERVGPAERQRLGDVGQRLAPGDAFRLAASTLAAAAPAASATPANAGAAPFAQNVGELGERAAPPAADRWRRFRRLRWRRFGGDLSGRVPAPAQPLFERRLLHLLAQDIVPAVAALPHQAHLVAEDGQVAHETNGRHRPECTQKENESLQWRSAPSLHCPSNIHNALSDGSSTARSIHCSKF